MELETLTVTARRIAEKAQDIPMSIQALTAKEITELGVKTTSDLSQVIANVDIALPAGQGGQPIVTIRGIGLNDYDSNNAGPNGIYLDEVYLSSPASQSFQTFDLDRIEVLKGPQGTLYGRNTSGGAINLITRQPTDDFNANVHAECGSFATCQLEGGIGGQLMPGLDGRFASVVNYSDGYVRNDLTGTTANGANNFAARGQLKYSTATDLTLLLNVHGARVDNRPNEYYHIGTFDPATGAVCSVADAYAGKCADAFGYGTPRDFYSGAYKDLGHLVINSFGTSVRADYTPGAVTYTSLSAFEHSGKLFPENTDASPNRLLNIDWNVHSNEFTQEFRATRTEANYNWVAGLYYLYEDLYQDQPGGVFLDGDKFFGPGALDAVAYRFSDHSHQTTNSYAAFAQGDYALTDRVKLTLGGRLTTERKTFNYKGDAQFQANGLDDFGPVQSLADSSEAQENSAVSWRAGIEGHATDDVLLYASIATGFKSGDFNGSILSLNPAEIALQLRPVDPEHLTTYEFGIKSTVLGDRLILNASAFYNDYRDMQVFVLVPPVAGGSGVPVNVLDNAHKAHTYGIDLQATARIVKPLTTTLQLGLLQTKLDDFIATLDASLPNYSGNRLPLAPRVSAAAVVDYRQPLGSGEVDVQASGSYKSHQFFDISNDPYVTQAAYWIENLRIAYTFASGTMELAAYGRNLSNQQYLVDAFDLTSSFGFIQGIRGQPRMFGAEINLNF
jgi:iron complex outermembrane receptor protein